MRTQKRQLLIIFAIIIFAFNANAATLWVNPAGSNTAPYDTKAKGATSAATAIAAMAAGDTLIYANGTYTSDTDRVRGIPSGTDASHRTVVKAETDFQVIFSGMTSTNAASTEGQPISLYQKQYIDIRGFIVKDTNANSALSLAPITTYQSDYIRIMKCGVRNNGAFLPVTHAGGVEIDHGTYCLLEDVFVTGYIRYGINVFGGSTSHHNILRRCVVRWDYCKQSQPRAAITIYGGFEGDPVNHDILIQNCMAIDGLDGEGSTFTGGFSLPHETSYVDRYGSISLNNAGYGFHSSEDSLTHDNNNYNCIAWDSTNGAGYRKLASGTSGLYTSTLKVDSRGFERYGSGAGTVEAVNNIFYQCGNANRTTSGAISQDENVYFPADQVSEMGTNYSTADPNFKYLVRSPVSGKGAIIEKKRGVSGTIWGDTGYNTLTDDPLWPWPYEDTIRTLFKEANDPPAGQGLVPAANDTTRGFCAAGQTLTNYIWSYDFVNTLPPFDVRATGKNQKVTLSWKANTANSNVTGYKVYAGTASGNYNLVGYVGGKNVGDVTLEEITGLTNETTYYFAVTTVDSVKGESGYSLERTATPKQISGVTPHNNAGINDDTRVPHDTSFAILIENANGINIDSTDGGYTAADLTFTIDDTVNAPYTRNLDNIGGVVRIKKLTDDPDNAVTKLWAIYDRSKETAAALDGDDGVGGAGAGNYPWDKNVNIKVDVTDAADNAMAQVSYLFNVESSAENTAAASASPSTSTAASSDAAFTAGQQIQVTDAADSLYGAKIIYENGGSSPEQVLPTLGPSSDLPTFDVSGTSAVGVAMNLQPPTVFNTPVKIFIPCAGQTDVSSLKVYYYNGTDWVLACDADGNVQTEGEEWMVAGSRVNHNETTPPTIEIQVYHFSGAIAGGTGSSPSPSTSTSTVSSGGGGGCFIATAAFGSKFEKHVQILRNFRDVYLLPHRLGQFVIKAYYRYSPPMADFIADHDILRTITRWSLLPLVGLSWMALQAGIAPAMLVVLLFAAFSVIVIRKIHWKKHKA